MKIFVTKEKSAWQASDEAADLSECLPLRLSDRTDQEWWGFGGCFNEIGWDALNKIDSDAREQVLHDLFAGDGLCRFNFCRIPIGASDYALEWYSLNEHDGDFSMEHFSIERDRKNLIPYIKAAQALCPNMRFFASPWSPPTWMKFPRACNHGTLIWTPEIRAAYARYFACFVEAYQQEGIEISQLHVQNEPISDQKFPSCVWSPEQMADFIREDLTPELERRGLQTEVWVGTLNDADFTRWATPTVFDPATRRCISGFGYQWLGAHAIQQAHAAFPELGLVQTENECGEGDNDWEHACHTFDLLQHFLTNGANAYVYWNMVLQPSGASTWGWKQNAMVTADPQSGEAIRNPEFVVMRHFSQFIRPRGRRICLEGPWSATSVAFENVDGSRVIVVRNPANTSQGVMVEVNSQTSKNVVLAPDSISTIIIQDEN